MIKHVRYLVPMGILLVLLYFLRAGLTLNPKEVPSPLINKPVPPFKLAVLSQPDKTIAAQDLAGKAQMMMVVAVVQGQLLQGPREPKRAPPPFWLLSLSTLWISPARPRAWATPLL